MPNNVEIKHIKSKDSWNKSDLTVILARSRIPKVRAARYIKIITDTIAEALGQDKKVTISDLVLFKCQRQVISGSQP